MERIKRLYRNSLYTFKGLFGWLDLKSYLLVKVISPIFQVMFFSLIAMEAYGKADITPYVVGNAFVLIGYNAFFGVGIILIAERQMGTLKGLIAAPCKKFNLFFGKVIFYSLDGLVTMGIGILTGIIFFGLRIPAEMLVTFLLVALITSFTACAMGLLIGCIGLVARDINMIANIVSMMLMAFSGVNFDIEQLPRGLQIVSNVLPLTHALKAIKGVIGVIPMEMDKIYKLMGIEFLIGLSYGIVAYMLFRGIERMACKRATIDIY